MSEFKNSSAAVLGSGAWGTALALMLTRSTASVYLWSIELSEIAAMLAERSNQAFLPGFSFPDHLKPTAHLPEILDKARDLIIAVPSVGFRSTVMMMKPYLTSQHRLIIASKGLDEESGKCLHEVLQDAIPDTAFSIAVLSGPSFAREVAMGLPTSVTIASSDLQVAKSIQTQYQLSNFQMEVSGDILGAQLGAIVKNIIAIAIGFCDGLRLGANCKAALVTRGLREMMQLGVALGAEEKTFYGLCGMGDLILTCYDDQSRNRRFGAALSQGKSVSVAEVELGHVVEGRRNASLLLELAEKHQVNMPICRTISELISGKMRAEAVPEKLFG